MSFLSTYFRTIVRCIQSTQLQSVFHCRSLCAVAVPWSTNSSKNLDAEANQRNEIFTKVNKCANEGTLDRMFAVICLCGKQFRVTSGDLILVDGYWPPTNGDRIKFDKILLAGCRDFTMIGRPMLTPGLVSVDATIIEKSLSHTKSHFRKKRRKQYMRINFHRNYQTMIRINAVELQGLVNTFSDTKIANESVSIF